MWSRKCASTASGASICGQVPDVVVEHHDVRIRDDLQIALRHMSA